MIHVLFPLVVAAAGSAAQPKVPEPFRGVWDASAAACAGAHSNLRIRIGDTSIAYWESDGLATAVSLVGTDEMRVTWAMSGEGERWTSQTRFVIASSADRMFAESLPQGGQEFIPVAWFYERCPDGTPMGWGGGGRTQ